MDFGSDDEGAHRPVIQTAALSPIHASEGSEQRSSLTATTSSGGARRVTFSSTLTTASGPKSTPSKPLNSITKRPRRPGKADGEERTQIASDVVLSHTSSSYELAEKGAGKVLIDSLQFYLDGLFSERASTRLRRQSAWNLFVICRENATNTSFLRSNGVFRALARLCGLLLTEEDQYVELILLALSLFLIESDNGSISSHVDLPSSSFQALVICSLNEKKALRIVCRRALQVETSCNSGSDCRKGSESGLHSKRKMKRKLSTTSSAQIEPSRDRVSENESGIFPSDLVDTIIDTWPQLLSMMLVEQGRPTQEELGRLLALTCVNSFLMAKAQACASLRSNASPPRGDDSKRAATADQSLARCQQVLSASGMMSSSGTDKVGDKEDSKEGTGEMDYLALPLIQLYASQLVRVLRSSDVNESPSSSINRNAIAWQILSVMDAFCFRNHDTQHLLSCHFRTERPIEMLNMREELNKLLFELGPAVKQSVTDALRANRNSKTSSSGSSSSGINSSSHSRANTLLMSELNCGSKIETADIFSMCLKCLVNFSHDRQGTSTSSVLSTGIKSFLVDLLIFFERHRAALVHISANDVVLLPPPTDSPPSTVQETGIQRVIYSSILHILALLTNLVESASPESRKAFTAQEFPEQLVLVTLAGGTKAKRNLPLLVSSVLLGVSRSFAADMVETTTTTKALTGGGLGPQATQAAEDKDGEGPVPVSDLILAAHTSLLLFALGCPSRLDLDRDKSDHLSLEGAAVESVTSPEALAESALIRAALPGGTWWLPVRALKAYLALQSGTGIFLYDNLISVLEAIRIMQLQDAMTRAHAYIPGEGQAVPLKLMEGEFTPDTTPIVGGRPTSALLKEELGRGGGEKVSWELLSASEKPTMKTLEKEQEQEQEQEQLSRNDETDETPSTLWKAREDPDNWLHVSAGRETLRRFGGLCGKK